MNQAKLWMSARADLVLDPGNNLKGEGHSKKRIFFVITNKKFMLS